jgi:preprotein translocase subunit YajC
MKNGVKITGIIILILIVAGSVVAYFMWNRPQRNVENEKGIQVTAAQLVKEYQANEAEANKKYLDKAIQVTGSVTEVKNNQDGNSTISLASDDAFTGVFCTLKEKIADMNSGSTVTIKGICSGMLSDVRLREAVVVK